VPKVSQAHTDARRQQILMAMYRCLTKKGFKRTTLKDICREAQLSMGAVYSYFASKEEIVVALAEAYRERSIARGGTRPPGGTAIDHLCQILRRVATAPDAPELAMIDIRLRAEALDTPLLHEQVAKSYANLREHTVALVREGQARGEILATADPTAVMQLFHSLIVGAGLLRLYDPKPDISEYLDLATDTLLRALATERPERI